MPFSRPTLPELIERAAADMEVRLPGADARLRRSNLNVLARVHAGAVHGIYGHQDYIARQILPDTADSEILDRHASIWGIARKAAAAAKGNVTFTGTNGTVIPVASLLLRADGAEFTTDAEATIAAGTATAAVTAEVPGAAGSTDQNTPLTMSSPVVGANAVATVAAGGIAGGTDIEDDDELRARVIDRIQQPPHGGAEFDYLTWAKEVAGVTRAWVFPMELGLGTVTLRFVRDDDVASIIPDAGEVSAVQAYIDERRPVTAQETVVAPVAVPLNFTFTLLDLNSQAVKDAITAELKDLLRREAKPGGSILLSHIRETISLAAGENNYTLTVPAADVAHAVGQIAIFGAIVWP
jgi:uncharacterized phage protein gp47/JayE